MVNVFGDSITSGPGSLQVAKKVVTTVGQFKDYMDEIRPSYELGFTPYRLHTNVDREFLRAYDRQVYVLDDVSTMTVTSRYIAPDGVSSKLVYFTKGDDGGGGVAWLRTHRSTTRCS